MVSVILTRLVILLFGTLYPAYASYKAVKTKNVREYVKWMMYWIVFALFTCAETFADILIAFWLPFYYELKVLFVLWLLSPATKGSSILYRKFVHPQLLRREEEIDQFLAKAREHGYSTVLQLGSKGLSYATSVVVHTALKGQETLVTHLRKSHSLEELAGDRWQLAEEEGDASSKTASRGRYKKTEVDGSSGVDACKGHHHGDVDVTGKDFIGKDVAVRNAATTLSSQEAPGGVGGR